MSDYKLYEYTEQYQNLLEFLEENPDIDEETIADTLGGIKDSAEDKISNTAGLIQKFKDDIELIKKREQELNALRKQKQKTVESLTNYLLHNMKQLDIKKIDNGTRVVSVAKSPASAVIHRADKLPEQYKKYKTVLTISDDKLPKELQDKVAESEVKYEYREVLKYLKELAKSGDESYKEYAELITDRTNLRIK